MKQLIRGSFHKPAALTIVFSFRNEEVVLPELIRRTRKVLTQECRRGALFTYELIFVNDASDDKSLDILLDHMKEHDDIRVINMSRPFGHSYCMLAGMEYASGDAVIYMDADLQDPPELIPTLLNEWQSREDIDIVHTVRRSREGESPIKLMVTRLGYFILHKITSIHLPIETGDFKLLSRRVVDHLISLKERRPFIRGLICWMGFKHVYVPYDRKPRYAGQVKNRIFGWYVINNYFESALISFSSFPLKLASLFGILALLADFLFVLYVMVMKMQGQAIPPWSALMIVFLFIGGLQFLCLGLIGLYLDTVYEESKNRPRFIIASTLGFSKDKENVKKDRGFLKTLKNTDDATQRY